MKTLCLVLLLAASGWAADHWDVKCVAGPPGMPRGECRMDLADGKLVLTAKKAGPFHVRIGDISAIVYLPSRFRHSRAIDLESASHSGPGPGIGAGALFLGAAITALALHPIRGTDHFLIVGWDAGGASQELSVQLDKANYAAVLEALRSVTGKEWRNLSTATGGRK